MRSWTLRRKLVSFILAVMAIFLGARSIARAAQSYDVYLHFTVEEARSVAATLAAVLAQPDYRDNPTQVQALLSNLQGQAGGSARRVWVTDDAGQVIASTHPGMVGTALAESGSEMAGQVVVPIEIDGRPAGALIVEYSGDPARALARAIVTDEIFTFTVMAAGLVLVLLVGLRKMVLQPLAVLEAGAARFGEGDLNARVVLNTGDELETVARALNRMAGSLNAYQAECVDREKRSTLLEVAYGTANELSQPLTVVLGYSELLREQEVPSPELLTEALQSIQRGSRDMAGIVRRLSTLNGDLTGPVYSGPGAPAGSHTMVSKAPAESC